MRDNRIMSEPLGRYRYGIDLGTLQIVRAVALAGSLTGAARLLGCSQPALTQHLHRVERQLGTPLVVRLHDGARLSQAGEVLNAVAPDVLRTIAQATTRIHDHGALDAGRVRLAAFSSASSTMVPELLGALRAVLPAAVVEFKEEEPPGALELLALRRVDAAITCTYPNDADPGVFEARHGLRSITLFEDPILAVLPRGHARSGEASVPLAELSTERWIAGCIHCRRHLLAEAEAAGFAPDIVMETDNFPAVLGLVARGLGVALLPRLAAAGADLAAVVVRPTAPARTRRIRFSWPEELGDEPVLRRVRDLLAQTTYAPAAARTA